jgi:hypothetical protein
MASGNIGLDPSIMRFLWVLGEYVRTLLPSRASFKRVSAPFASISTGCGRMVRWPAGGGHRRKHARPDHPGPGGMTGDDEAGMMIWHWAIIGNSINMIVISM